MTDAEVIQVIDRLRRAQPRNEDTLLVCSELMRHIVANGAARAASNPGPKIIERKKQRKT